MLELPVQVGCWSTRALVGGCCEKSAASPVLLVLLVSRAGPTAAAAAAEAAAIRVGTWPTPRVQAKGAPPTGSFRTPPTARSPAMPTDANSSSSAPSQIHAQLTSLQGAAYEVRPPLLLLL